MAEEGVETGITTPLEFPPLVNDLPKEFGEKPQGYATVFVVVKGEIATEIAKSGLKVGLSSVVTKNEETEEIFEEARKESAVPVSRQQCNFAYPRQLDQLSHLPFNVREDILIEALVDPEKCWVTSMEDYSEARLRMDDGKLDIDGAKLFAETYWEEAERLSDYLKKGYTGDKNYSERYRSFDFTFPEVLIPDDIPPSRMRLAPNQPTEKY